MRDLTPAQRRVLESVVNNRGPAHSAWALGRATCEALRKRGLISVSEDRPITRMWNPYVYPTEAGRSALSLMKGGE